MSWHVSRMVGTPEAVKRELQRQFDVYGEGYSKEEFRSAKPHLDGLIDQFTGENAMLEFSACGSASTYNGQTTSSQVEVSIKPLYVVR